MLSATSWKPQFSALFGQLQRSSLSVQINIAEGYAFAGTPRFCNHLRIAYASAIETDDLLDLMSEYDHFNYLEIRSALAQCRESQRLLFGLMQKYGALINPSARAKGEATLPRP
jgi:four helix bundle protein